MSYIDIIVSTYNSGNYLDRCINSIINQDRDDVRIIVQDGGSTDNTIDILRSKTRSIHYWDSSPDTGIYDAWNKAVVHSNAEWVMFLGADDYLWDSNTLSLIIPHLRTAYPTYKVVYGKVNTVLPNGKILQTVGRDWSWTCERFMDRMAIPHQGVFHHQSLFCKHGPFDNFYEITGDHEFLLRELKNNEPLFVPDLVITGMQVGGLSFQSKSAVIRWLEYRASQKKHGITGFRWRWWLGYLRARLRLAIDELFGRGVGNQCADFYRVVIGLPKFWTR